MMEDVELCGQYRSTYPSRSIPPTGGQGRRAYMYELVSLDQSVKDIQDKLTFDIINDKD